MEKSLEQRIEMIFDENVTNIELISYFKRSTKKTAVFLGDINRKYTEIRSLIDKGLITLSKIVIGSTFIEVFGKGYQKARFGWGKTKTALGYRLSVAFDLDSKLPIAYIITFGSVYDSQHLIPLVEIIKSKYGIIPEQVVVDRAYYGQDFFKQ